MAFALSLWWLSAFCLREGELPPPPGFRKKGNRLDYELHMSARVNLDLDTLRTLSVAHDLGSLAQAAEQIGRTPSAISLQIKRLQDDLGVVLFRKHGRGLALTEAGVIALEYARGILALHDELVDAMQGANVAGNIRIGCPQDFASILPPVLSDFSSLYPRMQVELRIEGNAALANAVEASQLDLAIVIGHEDRSTAHTVGHLDLVWIASSTFAPPRNQPLPIAALGPQCAFRKRTIEHLEANKIPYRISANSPSLDGLWVALLGDLGITARTGLNVPEGLLSSSSLYGLPTLGQLPVTLHRSAHSDGKAVDRMASFLFDALKLALLPRSKGAMHRNVPDKVARNSTGLTRKHKSRSMKP
jgi:DNA-binding transcriptional LysR family regulator